MKGYSMEELLEQGQQEVWQLLDHILTGKLKKMIIELEKDGSSDSESPLNPRWQLMVILKNMVDPGKRMNFISETDIHEDIESLGYRLEVEQPSLKDCMRMVQGEDGGFSIKVFISEDNFKVKLYKLEFEL